MLTKISTVAALFLGATEARGGRFEGVFAGCKMQDPNATTTSRRGVGGIKLFQGCGATDPVKISASSRLARDTTATAVTVMI